MKTRVTMLKVKIKSLADEARAIRLEERRALGRRESAGVFRGRDDALRLELREHRVKDVRAEQRSSLLAYAFLRGRTLAACEGSKPKPGHREPDWKRVGELVWKFGPVTPAETKEQLAARLAEWRTAATAAA